MSETETLLNQSMILQKQIATDAIRELLERKFLRNPTDEELCMEFSRRCDLARAKI